MDTIGGDGSEMNKLWYTTLHPTMMYCHNKFLDPAGKTIKDVLWTMFSFDLPKKVTVT